jgi:4-hydroxymandelate oxidase
MELGADAIVVSTHGGSALDYSPSSLEVLPDIVRVVDHKMKVLFDSGIRRGSDIVKALALGADAVLIGRMALWGLVLGQAKGLEWILELLAEEMRRIMVLLGAGKIGDLDRKALVPLNHIGDRILKP